MKDSDFSNQPRPRASTGRQSLVVRHTEEDDSVEEVLERLTRLETLAESCGGGPKTEDRRTSVKLDVRTIVAIGAVLLSIASYVIQDARNTSRQDAEIESTQLRLTNLEKISAANTEARVRSEVELEELRQGQAEIKELLRAHENETKAILRQK